MNNKRLSLALTLTWVLTCAAAADDGSGLWLKYQRLTDETALNTYRQMFTAIAADGNSPALEIARRELKRGLSGLLGVDPPFVQTVSNGGAVVIRMPVGSDGSYDLGRQGFTIKSTTVNGQPCAVIAANEPVGVLYGVFHFLRLLQSPSPSREFDIVSRPRIQYRLLDHWDNVTGSIERGYAGRSLWKWNELPGTIDPRYEEYARANASIGINGCVVNNVNANVIMLTPEYITKLKALAEVFRPYGIRVYLSIRFSSPYRGRGQATTGVGTLDTADPLDPNVRQWWKDKAKEIYASIPDFGGFLVKANSEGMPGPQDYKRTHAEGANMLAEALTPYGGIVMWRAFVYDETTDPDRAKRSYKEFVPLDGQFASNVFVQAKNGPIDFQPREPPQPLFGAMPKTPIMLELQITQEYLGQSKQLVYLAPMWKECLDFDTYARGEGSTVAKVIDGSLHHYAMTGIAGVANTGSDTNWCGHFFAQANWYAFGRLAWDPGLSAETIADEWIRQTLTRTDKPVRTIRAMMMGSWPACVDYMTPLGLHHIMSANQHYGPGPDYNRAPRRDWNSTYYHRADANGIGFDRSATGSGATAQYFSPWRERFDDVATCPEKYLLWFHHVPWTYKMASGKTLWEELQAHYSAGIEYVKEMQTLWESVEADIDPEIFAHVQDKLNTQLADATKWRDVCIPYFGRFAQPSGESSR